MDENGEKRSSRKYWHGVIAFAAFGTIRIIVSLFLLLAVVPSGLTGLSKHQEILFRTYYIGIYSLDQLISGSIAGILAVAIVTYVFALGMYLLLHRKDESFSGKPINYMWFAIIPVISFILGSVVQSATFVLVIKGYANAFIISLSETSTIAIYVILSLTGGVIFRKKRTFGSADLTRQSSNSGESI